MAEERCAYAATLIARPDIGMANEINIAYWLNSHHADYFALALIGPKGDSSRNFRIQLEWAHIWFVPPVRRNDAAVRFRRCVDDLRNYRAFVFTARADRVHDGDLRI